MLILTYVIKSDSGKILTKENGQYLTFDTANDAMIHIETSCNDSPYLRPYKLYKSKKFI